MKLVTIFGILFATTSFAAEPLNSFKFELSCTRYGGGDRPTVMIHNQIEFDGKTGECKAEKGQHIQFNNGYDIPFTCEKPVQVTTGKRNPIFLWKFTAPAFTEPGRFNQLVIVFNHESLKGGGIALSEDGSEEQLDCKKW